MKNKPLRFPTVHQFKKNAHVRTLDELHVARKRLLGLVGLGLGLGGLRLGGLLLGSFLG